MYCECGCGVETALAKVTDKRRGHVKDHPLRFVHGHNRVRGPISTDDYAVTYGGFDPPCWIWTGTLTPLGYGRVTRDRRVRLAHVAMYEQCVGSVPDTLELDHLCRTPSCIRPDHLEPVSHAENVRRGLAGRLKTHCANGHPWIPENIVPNGAGIFCCGICRKQRNRRRLNGES